MVFLIQKYSTFIGVRKVKSQYSSQYSWVGLDLT